MSGLIPKHFIEELVARVDLVELIGSRLPLKRHGKEYKACCPFHGEKTPSFTVVPDKNFYHCFGCGEHGNALGFLMKHDNLGFIEAIEELADRVGVEVPREQTPGQRPPPSDTLFTTLDKAAAFYRSELMNTSRGKDYFKARGLTAETAATFGLGYAPDAWDSVLKLLGNSDAERARLLQVGLTIERDNKSGPNHGFYDRFRDRVMFPIRDARGRTIGFGGRVLDKGEPKYMNSPETELFHKGRELYGLYEARQATRTLSRLLIVEGYMDVVRLHQAGITYAVATLGTATTPEHLTRVFRICQEVTFCFDGDRAGRAAAWKALENSLSQVREGRPIRCWLPPEVHEPDSLVGEQGKDAFEARIKQAQPLSEYFINHLKEQVDLNSVDSRPNLIALARPLLERIPAGFFHELMRGELAKLLRISVAQLDEYLITDKASVSSVSASPAKANYAAGPRSDRGGFADVRHTAHPGAARLQAGRLQAGRRNLVRQAIHLLVHHPEIADKVTLHPALATLERPGIALLVELIEELTRRPCASTGALLERWRERPDVEHLAKLAAQECLPDAAGAAHELAGAVRMLGDEAARSRTDILLRKVALTEAEKAELQGLLARQAPVDDGAITRT